MPKTLKQMANIILSKESSESELKGYFEAVLKLSQSDNQFPINLEDVWMLAYPRKDHAVRSLKENFIEEIDFQVIPKNGENPKGGRPTNEYMLSTSCLEYFIARKVRPVFEVYRQVFHKVADKAKEKLYKESEIKEYLVKAEMTLRAAKAEAEAAKKLAKKLEEQLWEEKARVVIESEKMEKEKDLKNSCFGYLIQTKQYNQWKEYDVKARIKSTAERLQREQKKKDVRPYELPF
jgi:hypothetical protein